MKFIDVLRSVDKSEKNRSYEDIECISESVGVYNSYSICHSDWDAFNKRFKGYYYQPVYDTDSWVGGVAYFLDGNLVAHSWQSSRKSGVDIEYISEDSAILVKTYIQSLLQNEFCISSKTDLQENVGEGYKLYSGDDIISKEVIHDSSGESCVVTEHWRYFDDTAMYRTVEITFEGGNNALVGIDDITFKYSLE